MHHSPRPLTPVGYIFHPSEANLLVSPFSGTGGVAGASRLSGVSVALARAQESLFPSRPLAALHRLKRSEPPQTRPRFAGRSSVAEGANEPGPCEAGTPLTHSFHYRYSGERPLSCVDGADE